MDNDLSESEYNYREKIMELCKNIVEDFGGFEFELELDMDEEEDNDNK
jgi:hypothetical protein